jgi:hypothetical protein
MTNEKAQQIYSAVKTILPGKNIHYLKDLLLTKLMIWLFRE